MGTTKSKNRNKGISRSRAALLKAGAPLVGRGLDVAIFQDRRKLAILQNAIDTIDLTSQESSAVESLGRKLGGCGKEGLGLDYYYTSSCVDAFTPPPTSNKGARHTPDPRIKLDRLTNKLKLEAKMCRSFACARCAYSATSKTHAKLAPIQNLLNHEKTEWKVALLTLQGKQNGRMSITERLAAAEAAFSSWRKALDAARRFAARRRQGAAYGAVSLFEAQVVDLNAKPWIKPHFHVLIACENQDMFNQLMGRLETFLDPAERRILGDTASDIQKVISYFCKENYAGHQRG